MHLSYDALLILRKSDKLSIHFHMNAQGYQMFTQHGLSMLLADQNGTKIGFVRCWRRCQGCRVELAHQLIARTIGAPYPVGLGVDGEWFEKTQSLP